MTAEVAGGRIQCVGGPHDGRGAAAAPLTSRAWIDPAGKKWKRWEADKGRVWYVAEISQVTHQLAWVFLRYGNWQCKCGAYISPDRNGQRLESCPLCAGREALAEQVT